VEFIKGAERMGKKSLIKKAVALAIITVFFTTSILPTISGIDIETNEKQNIKTQKPEEVKKEVTITCYNFGMPGEPSKEIEIPQHEAEYLYEKIKELNFAVASNPLSEETQQLQIEIIDLADEYDLLPTGLSKNLVKEQYIHAYKSRTNRVGFMPQTQGKASEFLCTFVSSGSGGVLPIIALPRLIPILMIPIPRLFMIWRAQEAVTSCGGLRSGTGFIAYGQQNGIALGFWGLGFTFSLPPLMGVYGLAGYSLYASVTAEYIEFFPPNNPPVISQIDPGDGEINVPLSLSEIRFQISDLDGDLMSYTVTTDPDIGSGSGNLKPDGVYSIPINDLTYDKIYRWTVEVKDGKDIVQKEFTFFTEGKPPFDPFDEGWQYRKQIIIDHTKVDGELNDFSVLVSITDTDLCDKAQDDGDDILFMDGDGVATKLYHEIEYFDGSTGEIITWIKIPTLSSVVDTELFIYYGNPSCEDEQIPEKVWDSHYVMVQHLDESPSNGVAGHQDSTYNNHDGTPYNFDGAPGSTTDATGVTDGADHLDGNDDYIECGNLNSNVYTFSIWLKPDETITKYTTPTGFLQFKENVYRIVLGDSTSLVNNETICIQDVRNKNEYRTAVLDVDIINNSWHMITIAWRSGPNRYDIYFDGVAQSVSQGHSNDHVELMPSENTDIGTSNRVAFFDGRLDEIRVSNIARNQYWISTEYNNQNDPSSFIEVGPEELAP